MFTEGSFENVVIEYLKEINYDYIHGSKVIRDNKEVHIPTLFYYNAFLIISDGVDSKLSRFKTDIITSNFCKAFSLKDIEFAHWFHVTWQKLYDSGAYFNYENKTTGIKNLLFEILCNDHSIISPSNEIIKKYNKVVSSMFDKIQKNKNENQELEQLRDFLLPLLMNGQVGFKELVLAED